MADKVDPLGDTVVAPVVRPQTTDSVEIPSERTTVGMGPPGPPPRTLPPPEPKKRSRVPLIVAGALAMAAGAGVVYFVVPAGSSEPPPAPPKKDAPTQPKPVVAVDAAIAEAVDASVPPPAKGAHDLDELVDLEEQAISTGDAALLAELVDERAFGFGPGAHDVPNGRSALVATVLKATNPSNTKRTVRRNRKLFVSGRAGSIGWISTNENIVVSKKVNTLFFTSQVATVGADGLWRVVSWHWSLPVGNAEAHRQAKAGKLAKLDPVPSDHAGADAPAAALTAGLASFKTMAAMLSPRQDIVLTGSAFDEHRPATSASEWLVSLDQYRLKLDDAMRCAANSDGAWCQLDIKIAQGKVVEPLRLTVAMVKDGDAWRIVQAHFSNGE